MGRMLRLPLDSSVSLANDLFQIEAGTLKPIIIHSLEFGQITDLGDTNAEGLTVLVRERITDAITDAGGEVARDKSDTVFGGNVNVNQVAAVTGAVIAYAIPWNTAIPYTKIWTPETRPIIIPGDAWTVNLNDAPGSAIVILGTVEFEEMG